MGAAAESLTQWLTTTPLPMPSDDCGTRREEMDKIHEVWGKLLNMKDAMNGAFAQLQNVSDIIERRQEAAEGGGEYDEQEGEEYDGQEGEPAWY